MDNPSDEDEQDDDYVTPKSKNGASHKIVSSPTLRDTKRKTRPLSLLEALPDTSTAKTARNDEQILDDMSEEVNDDDEIEDGLEPDETVLYAMSSNAVLHHKAFNEFVFKETKNTFEVTFKFIFK